MKEYDVFKLKKRVTQNLLKGSVGVILIKYFDDEFEVEFVRSKDKVHFVYREII